MTSPMMVMAAVVAAVVVVVVVVVVVAVVVRKTSSIAFPKTLGYCFHQSLDYSTLARPFWETHLVEVWLRLSLKLFLCSRVLEQAREQPRGAKVVQQNPREASLSLEVMVEICEHWQCCCC